MSERAAPDAWLVLMPFDSREALSTTEAARIAHRTGETMRVWCEKFGIGRKIAGQWMVSRVALQMVLDDNMSALAAYHSGDHLSPSVLQYLVQANLIDGA